MPIVSPSAALDAYRMTDVAWLPGVGTAALVLGLHILFDAALVGYGCRRKRWE